MKKILVNLIKALSNLIYCIFKICPTKKQIVYMSMQSNMKSLDFEMISEEIKKRDDSIKQVFLCKKMESSLSKTSEYFKYVIRMVGYFIKSMYYLATSRVCIAESYCVPISILKHKKNLKVIQIWHASGAVKKFGYQSLDTKEGKNTEIAKIMEMHKNYNYVIAPSEITRQIFAEAFNIELNKVVKFGLPRLEYITNAKYDKTDLFFTEYPELKNKKIILYVPTFRKNKKAKLDEILNYNYDKNKYKIIIRLHPLEKEIEPEEFSVDNKYTTYDLIKIADYIITDYSILSIEASLLLKPIFLYLYDFDDYKINRGVNIKLEEELKTFTTNSFNDIMQKIKENNYNMDEIKKYKSKYIEVNPQTATMDITNFILKFI